MLDTAAGTGALTLVAAAAGARVIATDFAPNMVAAIDALRLPRTEARVMDGQAFDLDDACVGAVISMFGIMLSRLAGGIVGDGARRPSDRWSDAAILSRDLEQAGFDNVAVLRVSHD